jgi:hypothetical protein
LPAPAYSDFELAVDAWDDGHSDLRLLGIHAEGLVFIEDSGAILSVIVVLTYGALVERLPSIDLGHRFLTGLTADSGGIVGRLCLLRGAA